MKLFFGKFDVCILCSSIFMSKSVVYDVVHTRVA